MAYCFTDVSVYLQIGERGCGFVVFFFIYIKSRSVSHWLRGTREEEMLEQEVRAGKLPALSE